MDTLVFFLAALTLAAANPVGPTATDLTDRNEPVKNAVDRNVQWLLRGIRDGRFRGPDLPRAVVALFLAKPGLFTPDHKIRHELRDILTNETLVPSVASEELALYVQALVVSCMDPRNFFARDLLNELWKKYDYRALGARGLRFPSYVMLALCNAGGTTRRDFFQRHNFEPIALTDEATFTAMAIYCLESTSPWNTSEFMPYDLAIERSGYSYYPLNLTTKGLEEDIRDIDSTIKLGLSPEIAASMQILMYNYRLRLSDLPLETVDFLLGSLDEDGSWGQSAENSLYILPVLSNKSFLNISKGHCPADSDDDLLVNIEPALTKDYRRPVIVMQDDQYIRRLITIHWPFGLGTLYDRITSLPLRDFRYIYHNGTDGKPYLQSLLGRENNLETGYSWRLYIKSTYPKVTETLVTESHADIEIRRDRKYTFWYTKQ